MLIPRCRGSACGSVLTRVAISPACRALVIHVLLPSTTYPSPSRTARVRMFCRSEPPLGSVSAIAPRTSPVAMRGSQRSCCSSVPKRASSRATTLCPPIAPARLIQPRASSAVTSAKQRVETADSLHRAGTASPKTPIPFIASISAVGYSCSRSSRPACGRTSRSTQCATASTIARSSSLSPLMASAVDGARAQLRPQQRQRGLLRVDGGFPFGLRRGLLGRVLGDELAFLGRLCRAGCLARDLRVHLRAGGGRNSLDDGVDAPPDAEQLVERLAEDVLVEVVAQPARQCGRGGGQGEHTVGELVHLRVLQQRLGRALVPLDDGEQLRPHPADVGRRQLAVGGGLR